MIAGFTGLGAAGAKPCPGWGARSSVQWRGQEPGVTDAAVTSYTVTLSCRRCGGEHLVVGGIVGALLIEDGPNREGTIAELYAGRELPAVLVSLLNDKVWCDDAGEYVLIADPARVFLTPRAWADGIGWER
jgi:hypothetical protein